MADITLSPIPYNGGTITSNFMGHHYTELSTGKYIHVSHQINPNYVFAYINNTTNLKSGTFTTANAPMRVICSQSTTPAAPSVATNIRLWKLSANRVLMLMGAALYVLEVGGNDDISVKSATIAGFQNTFIVLNASYFTSPPNGSNVYGSYYQGWYVRDNVVYIALRSNTSSNLTATLKKIVYDPSADTLTQTTITTLNSATTTGNVAFWRCYLQSIPGSTKKLFSMRNSLNLGTFFSATISGSQFIDGVTDVAGQTIGAAPNSLYAMVPLSDSTVLGISSTQTPTYYTWTGAGWGSQTAVYNSVGNNSYPIVQAEALDSNYFITVMTNIQTDIFANPQLWIRISRFVDPTFGQTSTVTSSSIGLAVAINSHAAPDQDFVMHPSPDLFEVPAYTSQNAMIPSIRVIYQPGA
ncbi:MAG: hypothetical protein EOO77_08840 [Oxalobacteraceae bacterium]|nr:MAG: hypothetical protein EOO77_08840 [Oxalobacteraceae bacterium]